MRGQRVTGLLNGAIDLQSPLVRKNIARARQRNPEATPAQVIRTLERMYVSALAGTGAAVGGAAAAPGVGTGVSLALSAGEALSSLELSTLFALSVAEIHGIPLDELERRRTIVMGILLGRSGSATIARVAERTGQHWGTSDRREGACRDAASDQRDTGEALCHEVRNQAGDHRPRPDGAFRGRSSDRRWSQRSPRRSHGGGKPSRIRPVSNYVADARRVGGAIEHRYRCPQASFRRPGSAAVTVRCPHLAGRDPLPAVFK